jgi:hypothetical protein
LMISPTRKSSKKLPGLVLVIALIAVPIAHVFNSAAETITSSLTSRARENASRAKPPPMRPVTSRDDEMAAVCS